MKTIIKLTVILCTTIIFFSCNNDDDSLPQGLTIGSYHEGGIVFYLDATGKSGLVCAVKDQSSKMRWGYNDIFLENTQAIIGSGAMNSQNIADAYLGIENASDLCLELEINGFTDWFLPSKDELNLMYVNRAKIDAAALKNGGQTFSTDFENANYWSSTEESKTHAWLHQFDTGEQKTYHKTYVLHARAIRAFHISN